MRDRTTNELRIEIKALEKIEADLRALEDTAAKAGWEFRAKPQRDPQGELLELLRMSIGKSMTEISELRQKLQFLVKELEG